MLVPAPSQRRHNTSARRRFVLAVSFAPARALSSVEIATRDVGRGAEQQRLRRAPTALGSGGSSFIRIFPLRWGVDAKIAPAVSRLGDITIAAIVLSRYGLVNVLRQPKKGPCGIRRRNDDVQWAFATDPLSQQSHRTVVALTGLYPQLTLVRACP